MTHQWRSLYQFMIFGIMYLIYSLIIMHFPFQLSNKNCSLIFKLIILMEKQEISTSTENFSHASTSNEQKLMKLVRNLQLELGYHGIALKKAEKMIEILSTQNSQLKSDNKLLTKKCKDLELKIVQYNNFINKMNQPTINHHPTGKSPELKKKVVVEDKQKANIRKMSANLEIPQKIQKNYLLQQRETSQRVLSTSTKKNNQTKGSPKVTIKQLSVREARDTKKRNDISPAPNEESIQKHKKNQYSKASLLDIKPKKKALSFIPFQELQIKTQWS